MLDIKFLKKVHNELRKRCNHYLDIDINKIKEDIDISREVDYVPISTKKIEAVMKQQGFECTCTDYYIGPVVTVYILKSDTISKIKLVSPENVAAALNVNSVRLNLCNNCVELEIENPKRFNLSFIDIYNKIPENYTLPIPLGENTYGFYRYIDLAEMPHLLVAGRTGSGKSVFLNTTIISLIAKFSPQELNLALIDPKQVEFSVYENIPHLYNNSVITTDTDAKIMLENLVEEMEYRFTLFKEFNVRKISEYNKKNHTKLPYIVCIIDEYADLILMANSKEKKEIENNIVRLAQKARAAGIHLILATQKPIAQVITGLIKSNMPARISFAVCSAMDSRIIIDQKGAENLLGNGDLLFLNPKGNKLERIQAPYISEENIYKLLQE